MAGTKLKADIIDSLNPNKGTLTISRRLGHSFSPNGSMTQARLSRERSQKALLHGDDMHVSAVDLATLFFNMGRAMNRVGWNHVSVDMPMWFKHFAPNGVKMDRAFLEDLLYFSQMEYEKDTFADIFGNPDFKNMISRICSIRYRYEPDLNILVPIKPGRKSNERKERERKLKKCNKLLSQG